MGGMNILQKKVHATFFNSIQLRVEKVTYRVEKHSMQEHNTSMDTKVICYSINTPIAAYFIRSYHWIITYHWSFMPCQTVLFVDIFCLNLLGCQQFLLVWIHGSGSSLAMDKYHHMKQTSFYTGLCSSGSILHRK